MNDHVLDYRNETGTVSRIYNNFTGAVTYDSGETNSIDLQYVSREVSCIYGFCTGDVVTDKDGYQATITDLFENGVAELRYMDGETWYVEVNELTPVQGQNVPVQHSWPAPRVYPDVTVYYCPFPAPVYSYPWPDYYPYERPVYGRVLIGVFPPPPQYYGYHPYNPYPYRPGTQWGDRVGGPRPIPGGGNPGNNGGGGFPGNSGGGNTGPRPGNGGGGGSSGGGWGSGGPHPHP